MSDQTGGRASARTFPSARLESWKEIAAYLLRDERTVRRWEKSEGLPVHRLQHGKSGSVFAETAELDAWRDRRTDAHRKNLQEVPPAPQPRSQSAGARVVLFAVAGVALLAASWLFISVRAPVRRVPAEFPLTTHPGVEAEPALSPDGKYVAYVWDGVNHANFDVYVRLLTGGSPVRLTSSPAHDYSPTWSPDGSSIAFLRQASPTSATVMVIPALGGAETALQEVATAVWPQWSRPGPFLAWSPDRQWLVVAGRHGPDAIDRLLRVNIATREVLPLTSPPPKSMGDTAPAISPDGSMLAFSRRVSWGVSQLCVLRVGSDFLPAGDLRQIQTGFTWNASPAWMPDNRTLIFSTGRMDGPHLARINISNKGGSESLLGVGAYGWHPSLARGPDGAVRLVYTRHFESVNIWRQPIGPGPAIELVSSAHWSYEPNYSPDGKKVAFLSDRSGYAEVWVAEADGSNPKQWTFLKQPSLGAPHWSTDSRRIAFTAPGEQGSSIYLLDGPGSHPRHVPGSHMAGYLDWSEDQALYFSTNRQGSTQIWRIGVEGGNAVQVTTAGGRVPTVSPDGRYLYYLRMVNTAGDNTLFRMPLPGGREEKVLDFVDAYSVSNLGVAIKYYRASAPSEGPYHLFLRLSTGKIERMPTPPKHLRYGISVSPDGQYLIYAQSDYEVSDLRLVDGL